MLRLISPPAHSNEYPKLEATGLGSILRAACTRDKEGHPERAHISEFMGTLFLLLVPVK